MNGQPTGNVQSKNPSRRQQRQLRQQKARMTLLSLCIVIILLLVTLAVFLFCALADNLNQDDAKNDDQNGIGQSDPSIRYTQIAKNNSDLHVGDLLLINNDHYYNPDSAPNLVVIQGTQPIPDAYKVRDTSWRLNSTALNAFNSMVSQYYTTSEGDTDLEIASAYRTAKDQENKSAPVGHSDHHSGYCLAIKNRSNIELRSDHWIFENGHRYGFIQRYPDAKADKTYVSDYAYCIRYVGIPHATYIKQNNLCLEEYVSLLKSSYTGGNHLQITDPFGNRYEVYYVSASAEATTNINVPNNYAFSISGDNVSGFIVTVDLSQRLA